MDQDSLLMRRMRLLSRMRREYEEEQRKLKGGK